MTTEAPDKPATGGRVNYVTASLLQRLGAMFVDALLFITLVAVPATLASWWFAPGTPGSCNFVGTVETCTPASADYLRFTRLVFFGLSAAFLVIYSIAAGRGSTIGKRSTEAMIVDVRTGDPVGFWRALLRTVCIALSVLPFGAGLLLALANTERRTLHDFIAKTRVISP